MYHLHRRVVRPLFRKERLLASLVSTAKLPQDAVVFATASRSLVQPLPDRAPELPVVLPPP